MIRSKILLPALVLTAVIIAACGSISEPEQDQERVLTVMTHDSFSISEHLLEDFQAENNVEVRFLKSGDTGTTVNKAILSKDKPLADVLYGVDNTFLSRALEHDIFDPYPSHWLSAIDDDFAAGSSRTRCAPAIHYC